MWSLAEASGTRADYSGNANALADNNTVTGAVGPSPIIPLASKFTAANSESLSIADNASLSCGGGVPFWLHVWAYLDTTPANIMWFISKDGDVTTEYNMGWDNTSGQMIFVTTAGSVLAASGGTIATATWYMVDCWNNGVRSYVSISAGAIDSAANTGCTDTADVFGFGAAVGESVPRRFMDGRLAQGMMWKGYTPTPRDLKWLYNDGQGRPLF